MAKLYNELAFYIKDTTNDDYFNFKTLSTEEISRYLKESIKSSDKIVIVAERKNEIIGFISGEVKECFLPISLIKNIGYISGCYVKKNFRNMGIAKKLFKCLEKYFREKEIVYLELDVLTINYDSKRAWQKLGFKTFREQMRKKIY